MKLYTNPKSPYARKCIAVAIENEIDGRLELIETNTAEEPVGLLAANPLGKIPALVRDDGSVLVDSPVICEYLDLVNHHYTLHPKEGEHRWHALHYAALADGIMDAAVQIVMEGRRPEALRWPDGITRQRAKISRALAWFEKEAGENRLTLERFTIGELSLACALGYVDFRLPDLGWQAAHGALARWYTTVRARPSLAKTEPKE